MLRFFQRGFVFISVFSSMFIFAASGEAGILFNETGGGFGGAVEVDQIEFGTGNALAVGGVTAVSDFGNGVSTPFEVYYQAVVDSFKFAGIPQTSFMGSFSVVAAFTETVVAAGVDPITGEGTAKFALASTQSVNYFEVWDNGSATADNLDGTGFNTGTRVLWGEIVESGVAGIGDNIYRTNPNPDDAVALDQFAPGDPTNNNYPGLLTATGTGTSVLALNVNVIGVDPGYFPGSPEFFAFEFNVPIRNPFTQVDPSAQFLIRGSGDPSDSSVGVGTTLAGAGAPLDAILGIGGINGLSGPSFQVQTDGSASFSGTVVPEPSAFMTFVSLGVFAGYGAYRRRRDLA